MTIKIKTLKTFLLFTAIFFLAGFNYLRYVKADSLVGNSSTCDTSIDSDCDELTNAEEKLYGTDANNPDTGNCGYSDGVNVRAGYDPLTCEKIATSDSSQSTVKIDTASSNTLAFGQKLQDYINSKDGQSVTSTDIQDFVNQQMNLLSGENATIDSLPEVDSSSIKVKSESYPNLNEEDKKKAVLLDVSRYIATVGYLLASNAPQTITTNEDVATFGDDFLAHLSTITQSSPDYQYFYALGDKLDIFLVQLADIEVPENMLDIHVKLMRIGKGILALRDLPIPGQDDPIGKIILLGKAQNMITITTNFFSNDFANRLNDLQK